MLAMAVIPMNSVHAQSRFETMSVPLSDTELANITGRFVLANGVELALSVTSDTVINGELVLRTVLTVDRTSQVQVFGRSVDTTNSPIYVAALGQAGGVTPTGIAVTFDRQSGIQTLTPTYGVGQPNATNVTAGVGTQNVTPMGLTALPLSSGGAPVITADGSVALQSVRNGTQVTLTGDQFAIADLLGQSIATAVVNAANNRMLSTVTNVAIDLRNVTPFQLGSAQMNIDALTADVSRRLVH